MELFDEKLQIHFEACDIEPVVYIKCIGWPPSKISLLEINLEFEDGEIQLLAMPPYGMGCTFKIPLEKAEKLKSWKFSVKKQHGNSEEKRF